MRILETLTAFMLLHSLSAAEVTQVLIDFGSEAQQTLGQPKTWNNVHTGGPGEPLMLLRTNGGATGITLSYTPGQISTSSNSAGVTVPAPGSALEALGWPASATGDTIYGSTALPRIEFTLAGLNPAATIDLTILGSRMAVSDVRTTTYTAAGAVTGAAVLDVSGNDSELVFIEGLRPDAQGVVVFDYEAAGSNTNPSKYFYLNALAIDVWSPGSQPPVVAFGTNVTDVSRTQDKGPFAFDLATYTNDGSAPLLSITAVDDSTASAPTWLTVPASGLGGSELVLSLDADPLPIGTYTATLTGSAAGYGAISSQVALVVRPAGRLNLLFYGNSYSMGNGGVHQIVQALAEQAAEPSPFVIGALVGGQTLNFHLTNPAQAAAIDGSLPLGEEWDWVVLQGFSTEATVALGNPAQFLSDALALATNVRTHSPGARVCMFQTWARSYGHGFYPGAFVEPLVMHQQVEASYRQAVLDIDAAFGAGTALRAAAGETLALRDFDPALYTSDLSHPGPLMSLLASSAMFTAMYGKRPCDLKVDFSVPTNLVNRMIGFGLDREDWREIAGLAERAGDAGNRRYPGSREDVLLRTGKVPAPGSGAPLPACPVIFVRPGDLVSIELATPIGTYAGAPATIYAELLGSQVPPGNAELHLNPATADVLKTTAVLAGKLRALVRIQPWMVGKRLRIQGYVLAPSVNTGSAYTTTDAHELRIGSIQSRSSSPAPGAKIKPSPR